MNKVFKVIWSEARNAYVVVSEMAKSHGTKSCSTKKLLAMLIATGVMTCVSVAPVMAKNLTDTKTKPEMIGYEQKWDTDVAKGILGTSIKAYQRQGNSLQLNMLKFEKYTTAKGENALAIRLGANIDGQNKSGNIYLVDKNTKNQTLTTTINGSVIKTVLTDTDDKKVESSVDISKYVKNEVNKAKTEVKAGKNVTVSSETDATGKTIYTVNADAAVVYAKNGSLHSTNSSSVVGEQSVVLGKNAASAAEAIAIGDNAKVNGRKGVAVGIGSESSSAGWATAIGSDAKATGGYSVALGNSAKAKELQTIAIGNDSESSGGSSVAVGTRAKASGGASIAISQDANASGESSMAFGISSTASGGHTIAIGSIAKALSTNAIAIGSQTIADKDNSVAIGPKIQHIGTAAAAVGAQANATGNYSVAMGNLVNVDADWNKNHPGEWRNSGDFSVALGSQSGAWGAVSTAVGALSKAEGDFANAIGSYANASGNYTNAMGLYSAASADYTNAMGIYSVASADYANAIGSYAKANVEYSVALGSASVADREAGVVGAFAPEGADSLTWRANGGAVSVGSDTLTRQITNVAAGTADTDAVNVAQLNKVNEEARKHSVVTEGANIVVTPEQAEDGHMEYNVALKNDIFLSGDNDAFVDISGSKGTIWASSSVAAGNVIMDGTTATVSGLGNTTTAYDGFANGEGKAATEEQLKEVSKVADNANQGWNLATNGVATEATNVAPGEYVDFSGDKNISVSHDGTKVKVELNKDLKDIESISNGDAKLTLGGLATELTNGQGASVKLFGDTTTINNAVTVYKDGRIAGVAAGINDNDAVNVSQLKAVGTTANMGWNLATNGVATEATNVKPGEYVDFSGDKNISVSHDGTKVKVELNKDIDVNSVQTNALNSKYNLSVGTMAENGIMPFFVNSTGDFYAAHNKFHVDKDGKVTATAGEIGNVVLQNGVYYGHSTLQDGSLLLTDDNGNHSYIDAKSAKLGKVTIAEDGKITGVAAGAITADSTDAVNGSQLHAVATEAGKHSKVVNGSNINVEEFDNDGQKIYKVNLNKDIMLGDLTGKYVNISGTNGTIETTGYIATKDRVYADKGAKLADIDVTGNKISNGASSIVLDGSNVKVNDKVTIDQNGKISGVAKGEISSTSTDAINGSQLHQTNENVAALDKRVTKNEQDIAQNKADIAQNKADIAQNKADIAQNKADIAANRTDIDKNAADIAQNKTDIKNLNTRVDNVEELAKKHTTVTAGDNMVVAETTNKDGGKEYNVALDKDINLDSVTTGQTVMNNDGLKVGKDVSVTATAVTAGKTSISDEGVKVGDKTYISAEGLNANDQKVTNVADGDISATSKDAVNGSQLYKTNQEVANNTNRINKLGSRVNKVGAGAAALAALHPMDFDPDDKLTFSAGYGNYAGENAAAIGAYYRPDEKVMFSVAGTVGNGENMVNAGVSFALDRTNHVSNSRTALAREVIDLRGQLAVMGAKMAKMEKAFGMLDETKTKLFPDVPANHWAYEYIAKLAGNGYIEGYPDGNFGGDRLMTRYEFAAMLYRAIENGAALEEKIIKEFEPELGRIRVDRISGEDGDRDKIERVRVNDTKGERDHYGNKLAK